MATWSALTVMAGRPAAERLAEAAERLEPEPTGVGIFEIEDGSGLWEVGAYFEERPDMAGLRLLEAAFGARPFTVSEVPEQDWVAHVRRELSPVTAGRFFVHGGHDADKVPPGAVPLLIEASMAFGTGHHGTTLGCLRAFDRLLTAGLAPGRVLDLGCGTAVLAMAAARAGGAPVLASDIDAVAVDVARANVAANGLSGTVECLVADGVGDARIARQAPFDLVFANILMGPLLALAPDIAAITGPESRVILSGILVEQAEAVAEAYAEFGYNLHDREDIVDWTTLTMRRARAEVGGFRPSGARLP